MGSSREAIRQERVAAREAKADAKADAKAIAREAGDYKRRKTSVASGSTCAPSSPAHSCASSSLAPPTEVEVGQDPDPTPQTEAAAEKPPPDAQALLNEFLDKHVQEDVDRIRAEIDVRRAKTSR